MKKWKLVPTKVFICGCKLICFCASGSQQSGYISFHDEQCRTVKWLLKQIGQYRQHSIIKKFHAMLRMWCHSVYESKTIISDYLEKLLNKTSGEKNYYYRNEYLQFCILWNWNYSFYLWNAISLKAKLHYSYLPWY